MKVVNFYGGPGTGKSTMAASVFAELKWRGYNVELVTEFAKDLVWEKRFNTLDDQIYIFGKQYHKLYRLRDQVDFIITDSPLLLSLHYGAKLPDSFLDMVLETYESFDNVDIFLEREKDYNPAGRYQTKEEAKAIDDKMQHLLRNYSSNGYYTVAGIRESVDYICDVILKVKKEKICDHEKVYSDIVLTSNPLQKQWICKNCGQTGTETQFFQNIITYDELFKFFNEE